MAVSEWWRLLRCSESNSQTIRTTRNESAHQRKLRNAEISVVGTTPQKRQSPDERQLRKCGSLPGGTIHPNGTDATPCVAGRMLTHFANRGRMQTRKMRIHKVTDTEMGAIRGRAGQLHDRAFASGTAASLPATSSGCFPVARSALTGNRGGRLPAINA